MVLSLLSREHFIASIKILRFDSLDEKTVVIVVPIFLSHIFFIASFSSPANNH